MLTKPSTSSPNKGSLLLLYSLVFTLVFEGIVRKLLPENLGTIVFLLKDALCLYALILLQRYTFHGPMAWLNKAWRALSLLLVPLLLYTSFLDLPLGLFAAKQYLLYAVVGLLVPVAFPPQAENTFRRFCIFFSWLVLPTTLVAVLQQSLPPYHWLNVSVGGNSLERFSAGGYLRVSSTFSFTGQYSWFLNAVCAFLVVAFFLPTAKARSTAKWSVRLFIIGLSACFLIGIFITGGRTAVLGSAACLGIGYLLAGWRNPLATISNGVVLVVVFYSFFIILNQLKPEYFAAYQTRSSGTDKQSHSEEIIDRIATSYSRSLSDFFSKETGVMLIGNGLGVMSNGSDKISTYARRIREDGTWTEVDIATSVWEGGLYLLLVWYSFRLVIIWICFKCWLSIQDRKYAVGAAFLLANVIISGLLNTIGMQPPLAIWWWLAVGSIISIYQFDRVTVHKRRKQKMIKSSLKLEVEV